MTWQLFAVESCIGLWAIVLLAADAWLGPARRSALWAVAVAGLAMAALLLPLEARHTGAVFQHMYAVDGFAVFFKGLFLIITAFILVMMRVFRPRQPMRESGALYLLLFTALLGMLVLASVRDLLLLFIGLELLTFSLYIMAAYLKADPRSVEAGMKYLVLGSVSSAFLVFGIALLYGLSGSTSFDAVGKSLSYGAPAAAQAGVLFVLAGLGFKIAMAPFNLWVPDVYEGAPTPVVALLSVGSKTAGIVALLRLLESAFLPVMGWLGVLLAVFSAATLLHGNLSAIPQTNIKRLLGYSSIGHAGYLLMGLSSPVPSAPTAVAYYVLAYLVSNLAVFLVVTLVSDSAETESLDAYAGLSRRSPFLAAAMFIALLSLAGVPPLAGFVGKFLVFVAAVDAGRLWLVLLGAVNVAIALYYYLLIVKRMYLDSPAHPGALRVPPVAVLALSVLLAGILGIGIWQQPFITQIRAAFPL